MAKSFDNFIPNVWIAGIEKELKKSLVFANDCFSAYEGAVKKQGQTITFKNIGNPTITTIEYGVDSSTLPPAERIDGSNLNMIIKRRSSFNFLVDDIEKAQADGDVEGALRENASYALADEIDSYVASKAKDGAKLLTAATKIVAGTAGSGETNVLDAIDLMVEKLLENNVPDSAQRILTVSPKFFTRLTKEIRLTDTDNSEVIAMGAKGKVSGCFVKVSNNVYKENSNDYIMLRTKQAIGYARPFTFVEAIRSQSEFADEVRGYTLYDAQIIRPKQLVVLTANY